MTCRISVLAVLAASCCGATGVALEWSAKPGIDSSTYDRDRHQLVDRCEVENREVSAQQTGITSASDGQPGQFVADIGAGTGVITRTFSEAVRKEGRAAVADNDRKSDAVPAASELQFPIIPHHGGVLPRPHAVEQPRAGVKVVVDVTADAKPASINKGFDRVARLLNLYGVAGLQARDVKIAIVLHGEATKSVLSDAAYKARFQVDQNPNLPLIRELQQAGVEVSVCGQALNYKGFPDAEVADGVPIAAAALTVVINKQTDGYTYLPVP